MLQKRHEKECYVADNETANLEIINIFELLWVIMELTT